MCLAQGPQRSDFGEARTRDPFRETSFKWLLYFHSVDNNPLYLSVGIWLAFLKSLYL